MGRKKRTPSGPVYYTTFQVARKLGVSPPTVVNWVNSGRMTAHRTPGGHRRITLDDLTAFARQHNYPLPPDLSVTLPSAHKVLIVDDEPDFSSMVREYLTLKGGYDVEVADSGFAAGLTVARFRPSVILMDILMPDMDGFDVLRMLRDDPETRGIPVIACTAYRDPQIDDRVRRESFNGYMQKPLNLPRLLEVIAEAIRP